MIGWLDGDENAGKRCQYGQGFLDRGPNEGQHQHQKDREDDPIQPRVYVAVWAV